VCVCRYIHTGKRLVLAGLGSVGVGSGSDLVQLEMISEAVSGVDLSLSTCGEFFVSQFVCVGGCCSAFTGAIESCSFTVRLSPLANTEGVVFSVSGCFPQVLRGFLRYR